MKIFLFSLLTMIGVQSRALDPNCTTTTNLAIHYCPSGSVDWYTSYTDIVNDLDALAKTAPSSFTVLSTLIVPGSSNKLGVGTNSPSFAIHESSGEVFLDGNGAKIEVSSGTALTVTSCGTGPDLASSGFGLTDIAGRFKIGSGGATVCQINFQTAYINKPMCIAQDETTATLIKPTPSTSNLVLTATLSASDIIVYQCMGRR